MKAILGVGAISLLAAACSASAPVSEPSSEPVARESGNLGKGVLAGSLGSKGGELVVSYTGAPKYRAVSFSGKKGDLVDIWVRNSMPKGGTGHPLAWLRDKSFQLAANADVGPDTEAHVKAALPHGGTFYVYLRDAGYAPASFDVSVQKRGLTGDPILNAEAAYDVFLGDTDGSVAAQNVGIDSSALPKAARAQFQAYDKKFGNAVAYYVSAGENDYFVVGDGVEEIWWVDLYDGNGKFLVHGSDGDSGPEIAYWTPQSWDPSQGP